MPVVISYQLDARPAQSLLGRVAPPELSRRGRAAMNEIVGFLQGEVVKGMPENTGALKGSVFTEVRGTTLDGLTGTVATPLVYGLPIERGRRPGRFPPVAALEVWARRKLGQAGLGFVIARAISRRASPKSHPTGYKMFEQAITKGAGTVARIWADHFRF